MAGDRMDNSARARWTRRLGPLLVLALLGAVAVESARRPASRGDGGGPAAALALARIDVNRADAAELALLPGIGPRLAGRIVDQRAAQGPFRSLEDLDRVPGIGPGLLARLRDALEFGSGAAPGAGPAAASTARD